MEFFRIHKTIPFLKYRHILNGISLVSFLIAVYWIFTHGLAFSIEFTGGTQMEVNFPQAANTEQVRTDLKEISNEVLVQNFGTARDVVIRVPNKEGVTSGEIAANVMKVLGYSVNESVIIFDRVREHFRKMRKADTMEIIDSAITATISRTVITHSSTLCMTLSMFFFGGPALHYFALALTIGILLGVYSSVFVAAAIAFYLNVKREDLVKVVKKEELDEMVP